MKTKRWWALAGVALVGCFAALFQGEVQAARDLSAHVFPETSFLIARWREGSVPLWLPNARMGQPFLALLYTQALYAPRIVTGLLFGAVLGPNVMHLFHAGWAFSGLWFAGRRLGLQPQFAFIGAAPFAFSPFFTEFAQNLSFASTASWAGWTLWAAEGLRRAPSGVRAAWLALMLGLAFHAGSPEMWLLQALLVVLVLGWGSRRAWAWGVLALAWAGALAAVVALPALELSRAWTQPGQRIPGALAWSVSPAQLLSIFIPDADVPREGSYWAGDQHFFFTLFTGSLAMLLAWLGAGVKRARPLLVFASLSLLLCVGSHFFLSRWLLSVPPLTLFRYPAKYVVGALFGASLGAGFGARRLAALLRKRRLVPLAAVVGLALGLVLASRWDGAREGFRHGGPWLLVALAGLLLFRSRPAVLAGLVAAEVVFAPVTRWDRVPASGLTAASRLTPLLRGEGRLSIRVDLDDFDPQACGPWDLSTHDLLLDARDRLSALAFVEEGLRTVGGYGFRDPWRLTRAFSHRGAFPVAGVSTFVRETWAAAPLGAVTVSLTPIEDVWLWKGGPALPRGFFVSTIRVADDEAAFAALDAPTAELARTVTVDRGEPQEGPACDVEVVTRELSAESVEQQVTACAAGAVILADAWYPGWVVDVDGVQAEPLRAWGFVRAVRVLPGPHLIHWRYRPLSFLVGAVLSGLAVLALLVTALRRRESRVPS